jgi:hypothetical protein
MSKTGDHAEDIEHELEHAGREVGESLVDAVSEPDDPNEAKLLDDNDE